MFTNEDIKNKSAEWSLNEDIKLLNKLKSLGDLFSSKSKEVLENVRKTDNRISNETVLVKNLINDFYLVGHKQFIENRVEEENESKLFKQSADHEESFNRDSNDQNDLIHNEMKSVLNNSLKFVREKLKNLNELDQRNEITSNSSSTATSQQQLNQDAQVEKLIKLSKYHQTKLPPIVNSEEFMNEVFSLVKQQGTAKKINSSLTKNKVTDYSVDSSDNSKPNTETSSIISDLENISINERILEINENNFVGHLASAQQSSTSFEDVSRIPTDSSKQQKQKQTSTKPATSADAKSPLNLDQSQTYKPTASRTDKISSSDDIHSNEKANSKLRNELDAIFGKASSSTAATATSSAKNRIFDDDSDDELFQPAQSQKPSSTKVDLFKDDSDGSEIDFGLKKQPAKKVPNLFDSNIKAAKTVESNKTKKDNESPVLDKNIQQKSQSVSNAAKDTLSKLFDSDSEDEELFTSKTTTAKPTSKKLEEKQPIKEDKISNPKISADQVLNEKETNDKVSIDKQTKHIGKLSESIEKPSIKAYEKRTQSESSKETSSSKESLLDEKSKMPNKKELFKNQLEDLFSKKRSPNQGFIKVNREKDDSLSEDNDKNKANSQSLVAETSKSSSISSINKTPEPISHINKQKEFDLFGSKPSDDLSIDDLASLKTSTLDNNLLKSRIKFTNRKRPTAKTKVSNSDSQSKTLDTGNEIKKPIEPNLIKKNVTKDKIVEQSFENASNKLLASKEVSIADDEKITKKKYLSTDSDEESFKKTNKKLETTKKSLSESLDKKFSQLFDDFDDDQLFTSKPNNKSPPAKETQPITTASSTVKKKSISNLFDDSDSDDELFLSNKGTKK